MQWVTAAHATFQAVFAILFLLVFPIWLTPNGTRYMTTSVSFDDAMKFAQDERMKTLIGTTQKQEKIGSDQLVLL